MRRFRYVCPFRPQSVRMPLPLYVRTTRFTQFPHFSSRWPAVPHWEWMFTTVDCIFYDRVEVNDRLTESSCFSGLWPVNLLLTQTLHCIALLSCHPCSPTMHWNAVPQSRSKAALQCWLVSPYWPVCVSECSCVRTVSDLLGEFSHFSAATWLSWAAFGLEQSRSDLHLQFAAYPHLSCLQITLSHLAGPGISICHFPVFFGTTKN